MSAHTPGPWVSGAGNGTVFADHQPIGQRLICYLPTNAAEGPNARLIAAAPELADALQGMLIAFRVCVGNAAFAEFEASNQAVIEAKAALLKANWS